MLIWKGSSVQLVSRLVLGKDSALAAAHRAHQQISQLIILQISAAGKMVSRVWHAQVQIVTTADCELRHITAMARVGSPLASKLPQGQAWQATSTCTLMAGRMQKTGLGMRLILKFSVNMLEHRAPEFGPMFFLGMASNSLSSFVSPLMRVLISTPTQLTLRVVPSLDGGRHSIP